MRAASQVKFTRCVFAAIISVLCVANAKASPVTYTESATISGSLNGVGFTNKLFTVTGASDTTNIQNHFINPLVATFSVAGVGNGVFPSTVFDNQPNAIAGFIDEASNGDILDTLNAAFASYDLSTSIGPITGPSITGGNFLTSAGLLHISSAGDATFTATVPLPGALPLFATSLAGLGLLGWRKNKEDWKFKRVTGLGQVQTKLWASCPAEKILSAHSSHLLPQF
jgi:hypothetical protein